MIANLLHGDCLDKMREIEDNSVSLIVTSPPYGRQRSKDYGGISPTKYVDWWMTMEPEFRRILKDDGTFVLNIKENVTSGERDTYVLQLVLAMREAGWLWTEEWCWHKKNSTPGKWPNRFRDSWERCHQFNLNKRFQMNQDDVRVPIGDWAKSRLKKLSVKDKTRQNSATKSGSGKKISNWVGKDTVYPTNVLHFATQCSNVGHSAAYPAALPEFFIKLFSSPGDTVFDPFMGSGTTGIVAAELGRSFVGVEISEEYYNLSRRRILGEE
jgi:DNA modification methylase